MTEKEYYEKKEEILKKFSSRYEEKFRRNAYHRQVAEALIRGADVFTLLETVLDQLEDNTKQFAEYVKNGPPPVYIGRIVP